MNQIEPMHFTVNKDGISVPPPPVYTDKMEERLAGKRELAAAYRIFAKFDLSYGPGGHITYRDPILRDHFWINPLGVDFGRISVSDLVLVRDDGLVVQSNGRPINAAGFAIHSSIHKMRPDVDAVAHAHSRFGTTFASLGRRVPPISQEACSFYKDQGLCETYGGVADQSEGELIGSALGLHKAVICKNHGLFAVGQNVGSAVFWFMRLERACEQFLRASAAGTPIEIDDESATLAARQIGSVKVGMYSCTALMERMFFEQPDLML